MVGLGGLEPPTSPLKKVIPCIEQNFQGCITPHPNPGVHVVYMCPDCWENRQKLKKKSGFRW